jgi:hypothetical protein
MVGEQGVVAGLGLAGEQAQGALLAAAGGRGAAVPAGRAAAGGYAGYVEEVLTRPDGPTGRATSVAGRLDRQAAVARLVTHHEVPFFVAVEGFARVLAPVVLAHRWGHFLVVAGITSVVTANEAREPPGWTGDQRIQVRSR